MKKGSKLIATVVAIALVITAMIVGIYAATTGSAAITANVTWTATSGLVFTLDASGTNGGTGTDNNKSITQVSVTASTSNTDATVSSAGDIGLAFRDGSDDGVNNPDSIVYTYTVAVPSTAPKSVVVKITSGPDEGTNVSSSNVTVAYALASSGNTVSVSSFSKSSLTTGVTVTAGNTLKFTITLSVVDGNSSVSSFDAGVAFSFE